MIATATKLFCPCGRFLGEIETTACSSARVYCQKCRTWRNFTIRVTSVPDGAGGMAATGTEAYCIPPRQTL